VFSSLISLLFPPHCLHCKVPLSPAGVLCSTCSVKVSRVPRTSRIDGIEHIYFAQYNEVSSTLILQAKEENNTGARHLLAELIASAIPDPHSLVIPIPSRRSANRSRGYPHATLLAQEAIALAGGNKRQVVDCLYIDARIRDHSGLSMRERTENIHGKVSVKISRGYRPNSEQTYIVDDLVTSGASVREALRALRAENIAITGVISACAALAY